jgi:Spy/CpxP family protein refolding chaperone
MLKLVVVALSVSLVVAVPHAARAGSAQPVFHQEIQDLLGDAAAGLREWGVQLQQHLEMGRGPMGGPPMGQMDGPMGPGMRGHRGMPGMRGMPWTIGPGSPAERPLITIMLHHRTEIGLSPEQVTQLEGLRDAFAREAIRRDADIRIGELDLQGLLAAEPLDMTKVEAKIREVAQLRADLRVARLKTIEQGRALLAPDQKTRLQELLGGGAAPRHSARGGVRL